MKIPEPEKIKQWCQARGIDLCILFGSQAAGKTHRSSDVDIALFSATNSDLCQHLLSLIGEAEDLFGDPIDLVIIEEDTDPVLRLEAFQHGKLLYESRRGLFTEQHIMAIKIFDDTEPLRQWRRRVVAQRILDLKYVDKEKYAPAHH
ncbi:MAG: nucleotidyltransferase domain-containing protein [candidate division KSB1 bacterium]|nr:nucleotidyltransferase domain-containing protein [candidate division KSB1 bacterium]MDZ7367078.1 nucleotidyltransferase domain-containing protein [candidate division KSB1 bacterium]MDZ7405056.1 nucleotidyltransferase domain-containing protein [candidate division KSB1 bacterium]